MLQHVDSLPLQVEELTPAFLSEALGREIITAKYSGVIGGTGTKVFFDLTYADSSSAAPARVCVKGGFGDQVRAFAVGQTYALEAIFYGDIAPRTQVRLPTCYYAAVDATHSQGIVILQDLRDCGYTFGDPTCPWTADAVAAGLEQQAIWHAATWGPKTVITRQALGDLGLAVGSTTVRAAAQVMFSAEHVERQRSVPELAPLFARLPDAAGFRQAFGALWAWDDAQDHCMVHGDTHVGNTFLDAAGEPGFLDWQCACLGPWSYDVAYFLVGALDVADRREHQEELLRGYLGQLRAYGGPELDYDEAFDAYRRSNLHGAFWALAPAEMHPAEEVAVMTERYVAAALDLGTFQAFGL